MPGRERLPDDGPPGSPDIQPRRTEGVAGDDHPVRSMTRIRISGSMGSGSRLHTVAWSPPHLIANPPRYFCGSGLHFPCFSFSYFIVRKSRCSPFVNAASKTFIARGFFCRFIARFTRRMIRCHPLDPI